MHGVLLAGGTGSRLGLMTVAVNKHLLPVGSVPMVVRAAKAMLSAGITTLDVVTTPEAAAPMGRLLSSMQAGQPGGFDDLRVLIQAEPAGVAAAVTVARDEVREKLPFAVMLADNLWGDTGDLEAAVEAHGPLHEHVHLLLAYRPGLPVLRESGVPVLRGHRVTLVAEKPDRPPSDYAVTGFYLFPRTAWAPLADDPAWSGGERDFTAVLNRYAAMGKVSYSVTDGRWMDAGRSIDAYWEANDMARLEERAVAAELELP